MIYKKHFFLNRKKRKYSSCSKCDGQEDGDNLDPRIVRKVTHPLYPFFDDEGDEQESSGIEVNDNHILFYTNVNKSSALMLNKSIQQLNKELLINSIILNNPVAHIYLHINSDGGNLFDGMSCVDYIRNSKLQIHSIVDGSAASAATMMSVVAKHRAINRHGFMLIHQLSGCIMGSFEELKDDWENAKILMDTMREIYKEHTKIPKKKLDEILQRDIWFDAKQCLAYGLVDEIL